MPGACLPVSTPPEPYPECGSCWQPGRLKKVQGIGWYMEEENMAQVSTNLLDFETTPLHIVYEEICRDARVGGLGCLFPRGLPRGCLAPSFLPHPQLSFWFLSCLAQPKC